jgi:hypothetical protein
MDNGKEVIFFTGDNRIMAADVNESASSLSPGKPFVIFKPGNTTVSQLYDINKTGTEVLAAIPNGQTIQPPITLVANWKKEVEEKK